jgi:hypothetical protein
MVNNHLMPKTVSARIENDMHQELMDRCNKVGCRISDFIKASIEFSLYGTVEFDFGRSWDEDDHEDRPEECSKQDESLGLHHIGITEKEEDIPTARFHSAREMEH